ncbi:MAG: hypothetical protein ACYTAF_02690 [Planctomycetota bacterium]|jgi:hypothetical protein
MIRRLLCLALSGGFGYGAWWAFSQEMPWTAGTLGVLGLLSFAGILPGGKRDRPAPAGGPTAAEGPTPAPSDTGDRCRCGQRIDLEGLEPDRKIECPNCGSAFKVEDAWLEHYRVPEAVLKGEQAPPPGWARSRKYGVSVLHPSEWPGKSSRLAELRMNLEHTEKDETKFFYNLIVIKTPHPLPMEAILKQEKKDYVVDVHRMEVKDDESISVWSRSNWATKNIAFFRSRHIIRNKVHCAVRLQHRRKEEAGFEKWDRKAEALFETICSSIVHG